MGVRYFFKSYVNFKVGERKIKILIVGDDGREHILAWKIKQSPICSELFCALGNAGTAIQLKKVLITLVTQLRKFLLKARIFEKILVKKH